MSMPIEMEEPMTTDVLAASNDEEEEEEEMKTTRNGVIKLKNVPSICRYCKKKFANKSLRYSHEKIHWGQKYSCEMCNYVATTVKYLGRHKKRVHGDKTFKCSYCGMTFSTNASMKIHVMTHTGERPLSCKECGKTFRVPYTLSIHMNIHKNIKPYKCSFCDYACRDGSTLRKHEHHKHMGIPLSFPCKLCSKKFSARYKLKTHIAQVHLNYLEVEERKYTCKLCDKSFMRPHHLKIHLELHDPSQKTQCPICKKMLKHKRYLVHHLRTHFSERPHECTHAGCGKRFKCKGDLKKHTIIHMPHLHRSCTKCGATFSRLHRLTKHMKSHEYQENKKRSHFCDYCDVGFYSKNYLIKHITKKHCPNKEKFICDHCGFCTYNKPSIVMHLKYGQCDSEDLRCKLCNFHPRYVTVESLRNHYLKTHNIRYRMRKQKKVEILPAVTIKVEPVDTPSQPDPYNSVRLSLLEVNKEEIDVELEEDNDIVSYSNQVMSEDLQEYLLQDDVPPTSFDAFLLKNVFHRQIKEERVDETACHETEMDVVTKKIKDIMNKVNEKEEKRKRKRQKKEEARLLQEKLQREAEEKAKRKLKKKINRVRKKNHYRDLIIVLEKKTEDDLIKEKQTLIDLFNKEEMKKKQEIFEKKMQEKILNMKRQKEALLNKKQKLLEKETQMLINISKKKEPELSEEIKNALNKEPEKALTEEEKKQKEELLKKKLKRDAKKMREKKRLEKYELERVRLAYNERMRRAANEAKNKTKEPAKKIKYFKEKTAESAVIEEETADNNPEPVSDQPPKANRNLLENTNLHEVASTDAVNSSSNIISIQNHQRLQHKHPSTNEMGTMERHKNNAINAHSLPLANDNNEIDSIEQCKHLKADHQGLPNKNNLIEQHGRDGDITTNYMDPVQQYTNKEDDTNLEQHTDMTNAKVFNNEDPTNNKIENTSLIVETSYSDKQVADTAVTVEDPFSNHEMESTSVTVESDHTDKQVMDTAVANEDPTSNHEKENTTLIVERGYTDVQTVSDETDKNNKRKKVKKSFEEKENKSKKRKKDTKNYKENKDKNKKRKKDKKPYEEKDLSSDTSDESDYEPGQEEQEEDATQNKKMNFKTFQCYICFKLFPSKKELLSHCSSHFAICSGTKLTKCPLCGVVTNKSLAAHMKSSHQVEDNTNYKLVRKDEDTGPKYCYKFKDTEVEVIPSVNILNHHAVMKIDRQRREMKDKVQLTRKLVKKGNEWILEQVKVDVSFEELPEFTDKELGKVPVSETYTERLGQLSRLAKKRGHKMLFPCDKCDKICQNYSALRLHGRRHDPDKKPFAPRGHKRNKLSEAEEKQSKLSQLKHRVAKPQPIKNNHKCDERLKKFYETHIRGADIEFWQFLKIFNKMDRDNIQDFGDFENKVEYGIHNNDMRAGNALKTQEKDTIEKKKSKVANKSSKSAKAISKKRVKKIMKMKAMIREKYKSYIQET